MISAQVDAKIGKQVPCFLHLVSPSGNICIIVVQDQHQDSDTGTMCMCVVLYHLITGRDHHCSQDRQLFRHHRSPSCHPFTVTLT